MNIVIDIIVNIHIISIKYDQLNDFNLGRDDYSWLQIKSSKTGFHEIADIELRLLSSSCIIFSDKLFNKTNGE